MAVRQEITDYMRSGLAQGHGMDTLEAELQRAGWAWQDISDSARMVNNPAGPRGAPAPYGMQSPHPQQQSMGSGQKMGILTKFTTVLKHPDAFFEAVRDEQGVGPTFKYYALLSLFIILLMIPNFLVNPQLSVMMTSLGAVMVILVYISGLGGVFVGAIILNIPISLFGGKAGYKQTFKASVYGGTTAGVIGAIPAFIILLPVAMGMVPDMSFTLIIISSIVLIGFSFWGLFLTIKGISKLHGISFARAAVAVLIIPAILLIITIVMAVLAFALLATYMGALGGGGLGSLTG